MESSRAADKIRRVLYDIRQYGYSRLRPFSVGRVESRMRNFANVNGIEIAKGNLYMSPSAVSHAMRDSKKSKGLSVHESDLIGFPSNRKKMDLYYDRMNRNFIYADSQSKYVIHPNYEMKTKGGKVKRVNFITAQKLNKNEVFDKVRFKKV